MSVDDHLLTAKLPVVATRFVGRQRELAALRRLVASSAGLLTLVGVGGAGKTRLALELAAMILPIDADSRFRDGVVWIDLTPITVPTRVVQAVSQAVGSSLEADVDPAQALMHSLAERQLLLVLDNCEELVTPCRELIDVLVAGCPNLAILATSRTPLSVASEQVVAVPPMDTEAVLGGCCEAAQLFYDRAARALPAYPGHTADLDAVNALCRLVDGLPLAIELAAPWIRTLSASDLLVEIKHSIDILATREAAPDDRHRSMQAVLDSTWRWLSEDERRTLQALGVFVGGFSSEAAALIAQASPALLDALGERSLIQQLPDTDDGPRYGLHELVRQHALQMLEAEGPAEAVRARNLHLDYFLDLYERARADLDGPNELRWAGQVRRELANAEAARLWALTSDQTERVLRLTAALSPFWGALNGALPHRNEFMDALALPWDPASETAMDARASVLNALGFAVMSAADLPAARHHFEEASALYQRLGDQVLYARALNNVGWAVSRGEDPQSAIGYLRQGLAICQQVGDPLGIAWSHYDLGEVLFLVGQDAEAERLVLDALRQLADLPVPFGILACHLTLGHAYRRQQRWAGAVTMYRAALRDQRETLNRAHGNDLLAGLAVVALALNRPDSAARLFGADQTWGEAYGTNSLLNPSQDLDEPRAAAASRQSPDWERQYEAGRHLTSEQAMAAAEDVAAELLTLCRPPDHRLTERETQILSLVAEGLNDSDIAARLMLSPRTVQAHLRSVFAKLGVKNRSAAVHAAAKLGLVENR